MANVTVSGLPGNMATEVARQVVTSNDLTLVPWAYTGVGMPTHIDIGEKGIRLIGPEERGPLPGRQSTLAVDYTHPSVTNDNCNFYCDNNFNFVMGTTGGDRNALEQRVKNSDIVAVIAPNMAKQIVAFQSVMEEFAQAHPCSLNGYELSITESHQNGKADTSGTAKAVVGYFNELGIPFTNDQIVKIRNTEEQLKMRVPEEFLTGHGWHTYSIESDSANSDFKELGMELFNFITKSPVFKGYSSIGEFDAKSGQGHLSRISPDKTILFGYDNVSDGTYPFIEFTHNVNGRGIYAAGTLDALKFLDKKVQAGERGEVYSMIDVLKSEE